jgi:hypothetical protein
VSLGAGLDRCEKSRKNYNKILKGLSSFVSYLSNIINTANDNKVKIFIQFCTKNLLYKKNTHAKIFSVLS